jgi:hypothetical protein
VYFQPELVSRLIDDAAQEPGALPLLQETLFQLWARHRNHVLALADYQALGDGSRTGLAFAVQQHADDVVGALRGAARPRSSATAPISRRCSRRARRPRLATGRELDVASSQTCSQGTALARVGRTRVLEPTHPVAAVFGRTRPAATPADEIIAAVARQALRGRRRVVGGRSRVAGGRLFHAAAEAAERECHTHTRNRHTLE